LVFLVARLQTRLQFSERAKMKSGSSVSSPTLGVDPNHKKSGQFFGLTARQIRQLPQA
jgi:hypothetical protein